LTGIVADETTFLRKYCRNHCQAAKSSRARYLHLPVEADSSMRIRIATDSKFES
jgi:hypothetical protein